MQLVYMPVGYRVLASIYVGDAVWIIALHRD
jgi:hypothetical protein